MNDYDQIVGIYSPKNFLTLKLKERFEENYLEVVVFKNFYDVDFSKFSYLIINLLDEAIDKESVKKIISDLDIKIVILNKLYTEKSKKYLEDSYLSELLEINSSIEIILIPEVIGEGADYNQLCVLHNLIVQTATSERIKISENWGPISTVSYKKLVDRVAHELFTFGGAGKKIALIGPRITPKSFASKILGVDNQNILITREANNVASLEYDATITVTFSLKLAVSKTKFSLEKSPKKDVLSTQKTIPKKIFTGVYKFTFLIIGLYLIPVILLLVSTLTLLLSSSLIFKNTSLSLKLAETSKLTANMVTNLDYGNKGLYPLAQIVYKSSDIFKSTVELSLFLTAFASKILQNETYDLSSYSDEVSASLDQLYTSVSFLQSDVEGLSGKIGNRIRLSIEKRGLDMFSYKSKIYFSKILASRLDHLLGVNKPSKYLVLFQNNMELRPTGGFIGSFSLVTLDKGRLADFSVYDVYDADGQLKGYVEPPQPIKNHLNEPAWYMRDANWDPDFSSSSEKIEWFLDKELGVSVDGVIAVDLNLIEDLVKLTGPLTLSDYGKTIDSNNFYQTTQAETERDFFPGSKRKKNFLSELSRVLLTEITLIKPTNYLNFARVVYENFEGKHIQIYLHDEYAQDAIKGLDYSGSVNTAIDCGVRCLNNTYMLVDANVGVNKANQYVNRFHEFTQTLDKNGLSNQLLVNYKNNASSQLGPQALYKTYTRLIIPKEAVVSGVRLYDKNRSDSFLDLNYDSSLTDNGLELGFLLDILAGGEKMLQVEWKIENKSLESGGELRTHIIKQAGTKADVVYLKTAGKGLALTGGEDRVYNTVLTKDFRQKFFFKK